MLGLIGTKIGMTRVFTEEGKAVAVTVIDVKGNRLAQQKTTECDGYDSVQVAYGERRAHRLSSGIKGHLAKYQVGAAQTLCEFRAVWPEEKKAGDSIGATLFADGQYVDVSGVSKGKGFAGVIKRHHFSSNRASHGNSRAHRKPGSTGQCQDPGRVFPGKKMPGQLGNKRRTSQNLQVVRVDAGRELLLIGGAVPGAPGGRVKSSPSNSRSKSASGDNINMPATPINNPMRVSDVCFFMVIL
jgi:large subunit ribosomal protein L3